MSTLFRNLSDEDLRVQNNQDALIPTEYTFTKKLRGLKMAIVFAFVLSLVALGAAFYIYQSLFQERSERQSIEKTQLMLEQTSEELGEQVAQYRVVIDGLRDQVQNYIEERKNFKKEFESSQSEIADLQKKLLLVEGRNKAIEVQISDIVQSAEVRTSVATPVIQEVPQAFFETTESSVTQTPEGLAVNWETPVTDPQFQVLTVNKKFNFIVINMGIQNGVKIGDEKNIVRNKQVIGRVKVEKLYDNFSAATILNESSGGISEGDWVE